MKKIEFKKTITEIPSLTFYQKTNLKNISLPSSVKIVDSSAFLDCRALETVQFLGSSITNIGDDVLKGCSSLKEIKISDQSVKSYKDIMTILKDACIGRDIFNDTSLSGAPKTTQGDFIVEFEGGLSSTSVYVGETVTLTVTLTGDAVDEEFTFTRGTDSTYYTISQVSDETSFDTTLNDFKRVITYSVKGKAETTTNDMPIGVSCSTKPDSFTQKTVTLGVKQKSETVAVTSLSLDSSSKTGNVYDKLQIIGTIKPDNATNKLIDWESSDNNVASCTQQTSSGEYCTVTLKKVGNVTITATAEGNESYKAYCTINVTEASEDVPVTSLSISKHSLSIGIGEVADISVIPQPDNATDKSVTWSLTHEENSEYISFTPYGDNNLDVSVTGLNEKENVCLHAVSNSNPDASVDCFITVEAEDVPVDTLSLNKNVMTLSYGDTSTLTPTISPETATDKTVNWSSETSTIAKVSNGTVTATGLGETKILAVSNSNNDASDYCDVSVKPSMKKLETDGYIDEIKFYVEPKIPYCPLDIYEYDVEFKPTKIGNNYIATTDKLKFEVGDLSLINVGPISTDVSFIDACIGCKRIVKEPVQSMYVKEPTKGSVSMTFIDKISFDDDNNKVTFKIWGNTDYENFPKTGTTTLKMYHEDFPDISLNWKVTTIEKPEPKFITTLPSEINLAIGETKTLVAKVEPYYIFKWTNNLSLNVPSGYSDGLSKYKLIDTNIDTNTVDFEGEDNTKIKQNYSKNVEDSYNQEEISVTGKEIGYTEIAVAVKDYNYEYLRNETAYYSFGDENFGDEALDSWLIEREASIYYQKCRVNVTPISSIELDKPSLLFTESVGETKTLTATISPDENEYNQDYRGVIWKSSDETVVICEKTTTTSGESNTITVVGQGNAIITASSSSDSTYKATCNVIVQFVDEEDDTDYKVYAGYLNLNDTDCENFLTDISDLDASNGSTTSSTDFSYAEIGLKYLDKLTTLPSTIQEFSINDIVCASETKMSDLVSGKNYAPEISNLDVGVYQIILVPEAIDNLYDVVSINTSDETSTVGESTIFVDSLIRTTDGTVYFKYKPKYEIRFTGSYFESAGSTYPGKVCSVTYNGSKYIVYGTVLYAATRPSIYTFVLKNKSN